LWTTPSFLLSFTVALSLVTYSKFSEHDPSLLVRPSTDSLLLPAYVFIGPAYLYYQALSVPLTSHGINSLWKLDGLVEQAARYFLFLLSAKRTTLSVHPPIHHDFLSVMPRNPLHPSAINDTTSPSPQINCFSSLHPQNNFLIRYCS